MYNKLVKLKFFELIYYCMIFLIKWIVICGIKILILDIGGVDEFLV